MAKETTLDINLAELSDEQLLNLRNELLVQRETLNGEYANELAQRTRGDFDPYTRKGERVMKQILKKYADRDIGLTYLEEVVAEEMKKRDKYKEEQRYIKGQGKYDDMTEQEFLEREEIITQGYKSKLD